MRFIFSSAFSIYLKFLFPSLLKTCHLQLARARHKSQISLHCGEYKNLIQVQFKNRFDQSGASFNKIRRTMCQQRKMRSLQVLSLMMYCPLLQRLFFRPFQLFTLVILVLSIFQQQLDYLLTYCVLCISGDVSLFYETILFPEATVLFFTVLCVVCYCW